MREKVKITAAKLSSMALRFSPFCFGVHLGSSGEPDFVISPRKINKEIFIKILKDRIPR